MSEVRFGSRSGRRGTDSLFAYGREKVSVPAPRGTLLIAAAAAALLCFSGAAEDAPPALSAKVDARFRRDYLSEVLAELRDQTGLLYAYPSCVEQAFVCTFDEKDVPAKVRDVFEALAAAGRLELESHALPNGEAVAVFWRHAPQDELEKWLAKAAAPQPEDRCMAAAYLAPLGDRRALEAVLKLALDPDERVAAWAAAALADEPPLLSAPGKIFERAGGRISLLRFVAGPAREALARALAARPLDKCPPRQRIQLVQLSAALGDPALPLAALKDPAEDVRAAAVVALGELRDPRALEPLRALLNNPRPAPGVLVSIALLRAPQSAEIVLPALAGDDPVRRIEAARAAARGALTAAVVPLIGLLDNEEADQNAREAAALALGLLADPSGRAPLIQVSVPAGPRGLLLRRRVAEALGCFRDNCCAYMLRAPVEDADPGLRATAASALGRTRQPDALPGLRVALKDADASVRAAAAIALGSSRAPGATEELLAALKEADPKVRAPALRGLGLSRDPAAYDPLVAALKDPETAEAAAAALGELRDPRATEPLIAARKGASMRLRAVLAQALAQPHDPAAAEVLLKILASDTPEGAHEVLQAIRTRLSDPRCVPALRQARHSTDAYVRQGALEALARIHDPAAAEARIEALQDPVPDVRHLMAVAMSRARDPREVPALCRLLEDQEPATRRAAAEALGRSSDPAAVPPLIAALRDGDLVVRSVVISALGRLHDARAIEPLIAALDDLDPNLSQLAAMTLRDEFAPDDGIHAALRGYKGPKAVPVETQIQRLQSTEPSERASAAAALMEKPDPKARDALIAALGDAQTRVRWRVARALGNLADPAAVEPLIRAFGDKEPIVRLEVARALGLQQDERALEALLAALGREEAGEVRGAVMAALARFSAARARAALLDGFRKSRDRLDRQNYVRALSLVPTPEATEALLAALQDQDLEVRRLAIWGLGTRKEARALEPLLALLQEPGLAATAARALRSYPPSEKIQRALADYEARTGKTPAEK